ncbi:hypothetical protein [Streptomyces spongiae]|uniref:Uncharacterized protein n=1 Tax=Streptomyces spongiae TaxID=565072 RepID=A0A5N8XME0_9ACTN|nr:hypothetical protein [Streptomyces spongiae]MPY59755.1 hypothetical protein [Streptomyces spongiae]
MGEQLRRVDGVDIRLDLAQEGFSAMWALELLAPRVPGAQDLLSVLARQVERCRWRYRYRFFPGASSFAADTDCTAIAACGLYRHGVLTDSQLVSVGHELLTAAAPSVEEDGLRPGVVMVYWEDGAEVRATPRGRKHDAVAAANALHTLGLALPASPVPLARHVMSSTLSYIGGHLTSGRYLRGTRYYPSPAVFLHSVSRLVRDGSPAFATRLAAPLRRKLISYLAHAPPLRMNCLDLALLVIAADNAGITDGQQDRRRRLAAAQRPDGSWPACAFFRMGRFPVYFGSTHLTTSFALRALEPHEGAA